MKIILYIDTLHTGGKQRQLAEFVKGLYDKKDIILELAVMSNNMNYTAIDNLDIKIHYLIRKNKKDLRILLQLYKTCKQFKPDIIHSWDSMASVYAIPIAKKLGIKFINGMIRNAPLKLKPFGKAWIRSKLTFPLSDIIVSNSHAGLKSYKAPSKKSVCIHNGFDFQRIRLPCHSKEKIKKKFSITTDKVVGMVASFSDKKDYETYISSAQMILNKRDDVTFLAVGDGKNLERCRILVKPKFYDKIRFLGRQDFVEPIIDIFNIGVLATYSEGISNSIMEYMALEKPVIAADSGGTKELVLHRRTGFLVKPRNEIDLFIKIEQLLNSNKLATRMGTAGKERIYKKFNLEKMVDSYMSLYESILDGRQLNLK